MRTIEARRAFRAAVERITQHTPARAAGTESSMFSTFDRLHEFHSAIASAINEREVAWSVYQSVNDAGIAAAEAHPPTFDVDAMDAARDRESERLAPVLDEAKNAAADAMAKLRQRVVEQCMEQTDDMVRASSFADDAELAVRRAAADAPPASPEQAAEWRRVHCARLDG